MVVQKIVIPPCICVVVHHWSNQTAAAAGSQGVEAEVLEPADLNSAAGGAVNARAQAALKADLERKELARKKKEEEDQEAADAEDASEDKNAVDAAESEERSDNSTEGSG